MARILHITNLPTPYRLPLYRAMGELLRERGDELHLFFLGYSRSVREWRIGPSDLAGISYTAGMNGRPLRGAIAAIRRLRPRSVILSWSMDHVALALLLYCRLRGIPCHVVSGETPRSAAGNPWPLLRRIFRQPFFRLASGFITYGVRSTRYLLDAGVPPGRITTGVNVPDTSYFSGRVAALRAAGDAGRQRDRYRNAAGEPFSCHLLFVGYFLPEKGILQMLRALHLLRREDILLHIVGSGEQEGAVREEIRALGLERCVVMHGYRQQTELPLYYALADILLFPSLEEVFGLVMAEGAAAGLPVVASENAGGTPEVVRDGVNGIVIDPCDTSAFAAAIARLADDPALRARMGAASGRHAAACLTMERSARAYVERLGGTEPMVIR